MKNIAAFLLAVTLVVAVGFGLSSCKDDEPPAKPKLSFAETSMTVNEDDGLIEVELVLDKAHSKDLRIEYELGGTASDQDVVGTATADYKIDGDHGLVEIESGETTGVIRLQLFPDAGFESDETIEIAIIDINTDEVVLTADDETVVTVVNDDEQLTASFPSATMTVNESDGTDGLIQVAVQLDKPATQNVTIKYTLAGTAVDSLKAFEDETVSDYYIHGVKGDLVIASGQTTGNIEIQLYTDFEFEEDETIEITLNPSNDVQVSANNKKTITLEQQNGKVIALIWDDAAYTDVDMDLFLWAGEDIEHLTGLVSLSANDGTTPKLELVFIPTEVTSGAFGLSHNYYKGSANSLTFEVHFADFVDGVVEAEATRDIFTATYSAANKNPWYESKVTPPVVQTFKIVDGAYVDITAITVPTTGSRIRTPKFPDASKRQRGRVANPF